MSRKKVSKELANWILGFLSDECSLDLSCVSKADRSNIENAIENALREARAAGIDLEQKT